MQGDVIVKKNLSSESSHIRRKILELLGNPFSIDDEAITSRDFMNNYANILKNIGRLEIVPFAFFED